MIKSNPLPLPPDVERPTYCAFIDVLGYGALITNDKVSYKVKSHQLMSLYSSVATHVGMDIGDLNRQHGNVIRAWSFSDSIYLQSDRLDLLVVAVDRIFNNTFGFYADYTLEEEWTPMLRCGIAKGWTHEFHSLSAFVNNRNETTPVGPGVANAYWASEQSGISGMKAILTAEVIQDLQTTHRGMEPFEYVSRSISPYGHALSYHFKRVIGGTEKSPTVYFELLWPWEQFDSGIFGYIDELEKLHATFDPKHLRHFTATAQLLQDSLDISRQKETNPGVYQRERARLNAMIEGRIPPSRD